MIGGWLHGRLASADVVHGRAASLNGCRARHIGASTRGCIHRRLGETSCRQSYACPAVAEHIQAVICDLRMSSGTSLESCGRNAASSFEDVGISIIVAVSLLDIGHSADTSASATSPAPALALAAPVE